MKLENSVKFLRERVDHLEKELETATSRLKAEQLSKEQCVQINEKLLSALNSQKSKVQAVKERYRARAAKNKCGCCDDRSSNSVDITS